MVSTRGSLAAAKGTNSATAATATTDNTKKARKRRPTSKPSSQKTPPKKSKTSNVAETTKAKSKVLTDIQHNDRSKPLLDLTESDDLVSVTLVQRPSKRNRSPYVADVLLNDDGGSSGSSSSSREVICHVPNLDIGGKCIPGAMMLVKPARDRQGMLVGSTAVSPKYGTPKCEFISQLLCVDETKIGYSPPTWVGAHPSLGEKIAEQLLERNCLYPRLPKIESFQREVRNIGGSDMRADFLIHFAKDDDSGTPHKPCVLEVKTVVDTDFAPDRLPDRTKCVFVGQAQPYQRAGIFPWGQSNQKGPNGEKVVSARAIKHVRELTKLAKGELKGAAGEEYQCAVLFVVVRKDAIYFRPNHEACPSFCEYLKQAEDAGVHVLAKRVEWGDTDDTLGQCHEGPLLDIVWPKL